MLLPPPHAVCKAKLLAINNTKPKLSSLLPLGVEGRARLSKMAGSTNHIAYSGFHRPLHGDIADASDAECAAVVIVTLVSVASELGMTEIGLKMQPANAGNPEHVKVIEFVNEPSGVTFTIRFAEFPAD